MLHHELTNQQILEALNKKVYGHISAKKALINAISRSRLRCKQIHEDGVDPNDAVSTRNVLLIGPSGTGKTYLVNMLDELVSFPLVHIDASQIQPVAASAKCNVESITKTVKTTCVNLAKHFEGKWTAEEIMANVVVFLDEFDKLGAYYEGSSGKWLKHTQTQLLTLLENTGELKGVTFILAGAFSGLEQFIKTEDSDVTSLGFVRQKKKRKKKEENEELDQAIIDYGFLPEIIGRIHSIVKLDKLEKKDYTNILNKTLIPKAIKDLKIYGQNFPDLGKTKINKIVAKAMKSGQGVRMLNKEIQKVTEDLEFFYEDVSPPNVTINGVLEELDEILGLREKS